MGWNDEFPLRIPYPRTAEWYSGDWGELAEWCDQAFGQGNWEYFNSEFAFKNEKQVNWFKLRWLN